MATSDTWRDFDQVTNTIRAYFTVDKLKAIISALNDECAAGLGKTGKKNDLILRITTYLGGLKTMVVDDKWLKAKDIISQVRNTGSYDFTSRFANSVPTFGGGTTSYAVKTAPYTPIGASTSHLPPYNAYAPPRTNGAVASSSTTTAAVRPLSIRFRDSPFFNVDQLVSGVVECPESTGATDRRQQSLTFTLNSDALTKMKAPSKYQLRLFCTSSVHYSMVNKMPINGPCPVEFPPTCEVRVNGTQLTANLKGIKKKPGTAPPPDLAKYIRLGMANRIEMIYVNSQSPPQPGKKFYLAVMLVETNSIEKLVENLKLNRYRSSEEIRRQMQAAMDDDDDIQAGPLKMSLKCPLSFMRVTTPSRSSKCPHPQCFDAMSWFSMMEANTTYLCPTCERVLDHRDLIFDGYFDEILKQTDEDTDDVMVEADGEWHTVDNKYGSAKWKAEHPFAPKTLTPIRQPSTQPVTTNGVDEKGKGKLEVFVLSDDDDDGPMKRESPSTHRQSFDSGPSRSARSQSTVVEEVIDLTLTDDEEPTSPSPLPPPPPPPVVPAVAPTLKRKAVEIPDLASLDSWKKPRGSVHETHVVRAAPPAAPNAVTHQGHQPHTYSQVSRPVHVPPFRSPPVATRPAARYHGYEPTQTLSNTYPQQQGPYATGASRPGLTDSRQLPPPPSLVGGGLGNFPPRVNNPPPPSRPWAN